MKKFLVLVNISLNANDEYRDNIEDIFIEVIEAPSQAEAYMLAQHKVSGQDIENLCSFSVGYDYEVHVKEV